jgi:hypothetical protein
MTEIDRLVDELNRAYDGDPWHGSPTTKILTGICARDAVSRPVPTANSIWEIVLHMTAWAGEVGHRLRGGIPGIPKEGDWPAVGETGDAAWERAKEDLARVHAMLLKEMASTPEERLWETVGPPERDRAQGTGITFYQMLHGLVQHDVYHTAQIATLRRLIDDRAHT